MRMRVITPPATFVTPAEAKRHLRVDHDDDDELIGVLIDAAQQHIDGPAGWLGRALGVQTIELTDACWRDRSFRLPCPPTIDLVSVKYLDANGDQQTVDPVNYARADDLLWFRPGFSTPSLGSFPDAVRIRYQAGYEEIPAPIRAAMLLHIGTLYAHRESVTDGDAPAVVP